MLTKNDIYKGIVSIIFNNTVLVVVGFVYVCLFQTMLLKIMSNSRETTVYGVVEIIDIKADSTIDKPDSK